MNGHLSVEWWVVFVLINLFYSGGIDPKKDKTLAIYALVSLTIINIVLLFLRFV
ncbi:hypothetical protein [Lactobacillus taiwanensis]|uniref:hypothetical protein n=1 Tax=Lactobacillus taiwanensis TaxID=508451 RepID=UPI0024303A09|nr:hypothetical protein [Lactobacillus taiwanensis]